MEKQRTSPLSGDARQVELTQAIVHALQIADALEIDLVALKLSEALDALEKHQTLYSS